MFPFTRQRAPRRNRERLNINPDGVNAKLVRDSDPKLWLISEDGIVKCFVSKFKNTKTETCPFQVFHTIVGQGPVHCGELVGSDYIAESPEQAFENARQVLLRLH